MSANDPSTHLSANERLLICMLGAVALVAALLTTLHPLQLSVVEKDASGKVTKNTTSEVARTELAVLCTAIGSILLLIGANGSRFTKLTLGSASFEARTPEVKAADKTAREQPNVKDVQPAVEPSAEETEPVAPQSGNAILSNTALSVFSRDAVPARVLQDALDLWPDPKTKPRDLSTLEFAARKPGKGNYPWILKFANSAPIRVSYGGRGNPNATVQPHD